MMVTLSVPFAVGFIALADVAAETCREPNVGDLYEAVTGGDCGDLRAGQAVAVEKGMEG